MYAPVYTCTPLHIVPCARSWKINNDAGPYTFMPMPGLATSCTRHECIWTCVTIYHARPCTGQNVYAVAYMCTPWGNVYATVFNLLDWRWSWGWAWQQKCASNYMKLQNRGFNWGYLAGVGVTRFIQGFDPIVREPARQHDWWLFTWLGLVRVKNNNSVLVTKLVSFIIQQSRQW